MTNNTIQTIGCDLGDKWSTVYVLEADGTGRRDRLRTTPDAMRQFFGRPPAHVVIEVGTHSRWVSSQLTELGHRVTVANPRRVQLISASNSKSDEADCQLLARLGRVDAELLAPVEHRGRQAHVDLAQLKARDVLVRMRTSLVNHIRAVVKAHGKRMPTTTTEAFVRKTETLLPAELAPALGPVYQTIRALDTQVKELESTIERTAKRYPDVEVLSQPNGVGPLTAMAFLLTVEDKTRFKTSRMAGDKPMVTAPNPKEFREPYRPVRVTAKLCLGLEPAVQMDSTRTGRTPTCTGRLQAPANSAYGSLAVRYLVALSDRASHLLLDTGRPPHGSKAGPSGA